MKIPALSALAILFIALKLTGVISWSWWLILLPVWGGAILWILIFAVGILALARSSPPRRGGFL